MARRSSQTDVKRQRKNAEVAIVMGSTSDWNTMKEAAVVLEKFGISFEAKVLSAHRMPHEMQEFATDAHELGFKLIIAGAGGAAHLPGMCAAYSVLPVIGVPVAHGPLQGLDALYSIVQMPKGVPVATVAIGQAWNAGFLAVQMLSIAKPDLVKEILREKEKMRIDANKPLPG